MRRAVLIFMVVCCVCQSNAAHDNSQKEVETAFQRFLEALHDAGEVSDTDDRRRTRNVCLGFRRTSVIAWTVLVSIEPIMRSKADMQGHMPFTMISALCFEVHLCGSILE